MGKAIELGVKNMRPDAERYRAWTHQMLNQFREQLGAETIMLNGHPTQRLAHTLSISIKGVESRSLVVQLKNIAISTGSACTTASVEPSHVILAPGSGAERAHNTIRIGVGRDNSEQDIMHASDSIITSVQRLRRLVSGRAER